MAEFFVLKGDSGQCLHVTYSSGQELNLITITAQSAMSGAIHPLAIIQSLL